MKIIGHRGAKGLAPENTLESFRKALEHHVDEIECDVRVTSDEVAILNHDSHLHNEAGQHFAIDSHTYKELLAEKPDLVTLEEAARFIDHLVPLQIEVKPDEPEEPVVRVLTKLGRNGWQPTDFLLASKDFVLLRALHTTLPDIPTVVIERWSGVRAGHRARKLGTKRVSMNQLWLWSGFIRATRHGGWQLSAYPLNSPSKARRWAKLGLYGAITDYPDVLHDHSREDT